MNNISQFSSLPKEIRTVIFSYLDVNDLNSVTKVSKWCQRDAEPCWKSLYDKERKFSITGTDSWRARFIAEVLRQTLFHQEESQKYLNEKLIINDLTIKNWVENSPLTEQFLIEDDAELFEIGGGISNESLSAVSRGCLSLREFSLMTAKLDRFHKITSQALIDLTSTHSSLRNLTLDNCSSIDFSQLKEILAPCKKLESFSFTHLTISIDELIKYLAKRYPNLENLCLRASGDVSDESEELLRNLENLRTLVIFSTSLNKVLINESASSDEEVT